MSHAIENLMEAQKIAMKIRPKVGGFPYLAEVLRQAGVTRNFWTLPSCQSLFLTKEGPVVMPGTSLVSGIVDVPKFNKEALIKALRIDQAGESTFPEFLSATWNAGVVSYDVDFIKRTVTYFGCQGDSYLEEYPVVKVKTLTPEHTAVRVALWRALHVQTDPTPHILSDEIGEKLVAEDGWRNRQDMNPEFSKNMRASVVGRARFIEDLVEELINQGVEQYVILGAGIDTFAQRRPELGSRMQVFEVDQPGPQEWKQRRLIEIGFAIPKWLHFVPVDFSARESWWDQLISSGFDTKKKTVVVSTGVSMYLTKETNMKTLQKISELAPDSVFAMTFMLSLDLLEPKERTILEFVMKKARESGTPFLSLFTPNEILEMAKKAGCKNAQYVSADEIYQLYFAKRSDGLRAGSAETFLVLTT
jgi:methyltransferase (TIGR00027 family)